MFSLGIVDATREQIGNRAIRWCMVLVLLCGTVFARFGLNFGSYSLDFSLIAFYVLLAALMLARHAVIDTGMTLLYIAGVVVAGASLLAGTEMASIDRSSPTSALLLAAIYLPLCFTIPPSASNAAEWEWVIAAFSNVALFCALAGVIQFYAQFIASPPWLFDFTPWVPEFLRGPNLYNTVIEVGDLHKSNGFFLREPSAFSFLVALAAVLEFGTRRRWHRLALFVFALLLTYSGSGVLALAVALLFPLSPHSALRLLIAAAVGFVIFLVLGDTLNLSLTINRIGEFDSEHSSGYVRYIAPMRVVMESLLSMPWALLLGHGPGTYTRTAQSVAAFDPTWAKLLFEYGGLGTAIFVSIVWRALKQSTANPQWRAMLFFSWFIMDGHLLSPDNVSMLFVLVGAWRARGISWERGPANAPLVTA